MSIVNHPRTDDHEHSQLRDPALDYISVKGFRSIKSIQKLALRPLNVLIGANGSGKSNLLEVFRFLKELRSGNLVQYADAAGGASKVLHFGRKVTQNIELEISFHNEKNGYHVELSPTSEDRFYAHDERCWFWNKAQFPSRYTERLEGDGKEAGISRPQQRIPNWVQLRLSSWMIYHFHDTSASSPIKATGDLDDNRLFRSNAANLAAYLSFLSQQHFTEYQLILKTVQLVAPFVRGFHLEPLRLNPSKIRLEWIHKSSDDYFDASALSDGTLRFICLCTLFLQPPAYRPSVILVDEPELGLHPYAIAMLANLIKSASTKSQIVVSTQSALLLDHFEPEDVLVAELEDGATHIDRLESQSLAQWLDEYSLGQLWEKNQFGGRPARA